MTEQALQQYLIKKYPKGGRGLRVEGILCKQSGKAERKNLKNDFSGHENKLRFSAF